MPWFGFVVKLGGKFKGEGRGRWRVGVCKKCHLPNKHSDFSRYWHVPVLGQARKKE